MKVCQKFGYKFYEMETTPQQVKDSIDFAHAYVSDMKDHYARERNQKNTDRMLQQKITGTCFEFALYNTLKKFGDCTEPDTTIWDKSKKNFAKDMVFIGGSGNPLYIHAKSQEIQTIKYADYISYAFQVQDRLIHSPKLNDYIMCGLVEDNYNHRLVIKLNANKVLGLYGEPKMEKLRGDKKFLYLKDIIKAGLDPLGGNK
jgi:hypothetical protein